MCDAALLREACTFLGVDRSAGAEHVRAAWKRKLKEVHPDMGGTTEAAQHATNMRDVLLAWIEAGRPDLEPRADPDPAAYARARSRTRDFTWQHMPQPQPAHSWNGLWAMVAILWIVTLLAGLADRPRTSYRWPPPSYQPQFATQFAAGLNGRLPPCVGTNVLDDMLKGKCWPAQPLTSELQFATGGYDRPICSGVNIFEETKAVLNGICWPAARPR